MNRRVDPILLCASWSAGGPRRAVTTMMGNKATTGPFAPLVVVTRNILVGTSGGHHHRHACWWPHKPLAGVNRSILDHVLVPPCPLQGDKEFNNFRGKAISVHSQSERAGDWGGGGGPALRLARCIARGSRRSLATVDPWPRVAGPWRCACGMPHTDSDEPGCSDAACVLHSATNNMVAALICSHSHQGVLQALGRRQQAGPGGDPPGKEERRVAGLPGISSTAA